MKLSYLAENCDLSVAGNFDFEIENIAFAANAAENDLAVAFSEKDIFSTRAQVVLTEPRVLLADKIFIYCIYGGIISALTDVANFFVHAGLRKNYDAPPNYQQKSNGVFCGSNVKIGAGTLIEPFVTIGDEVEIGANCLIESNSTIGSGTIIGDNCVVHSGARIGAKSFLHYDEGGAAKVFFGIGRAILNDGVQIGYNSIVQRGTLSDTVIGARALIGNLAVIAHDVKIGADSHIVCQAGIAGGAQLGAHVKILAQSGVVDNVKIADCATLLSKSVATKNVAHGKIISGLYGREHAEELKMQALLRKLKRT